MLRIKSVTIEALVANLASNQVQLRVKPSLKMSDVIRCNEQMKFLPHLEIGGMLISLERGRPDWAVRLLLFIVIRYVPRRCCRIRPVSLEDTITANTSRMLGTVNEKARRARKLVGIKRSQV